jgi:CDP-glycerol glycerophosphotransferase (TagB/SpsB family)
MNSETGVWELVPDFEESNFYKFYNALLNDKELITTAYKLGYKIQFMPHPIFSPHIKRFTKNQNVTFLNIEKPYRELYSESALILTDYSSAVFDFAYLGKPIVYAQFDREELSKKGTTYNLDTSFYDNNAFGEICFDYKSTRKTLISYMKNGCKLKPEYKKRMDDFFEYRDKNNCERIVKELKNINLLK